jgi:hypothetical protein
MGIGLVKRFLFNAWRDPARDRLEIYLSMPQVSPGTA